MTEQICTSPNLPRRGKAATTVAIETSILEIVAERAPITVRGIAYALFTRGLIDSMAVGQTAKVSRITTAMREAGRLDWTQIVDGSRTVEKTSAWRDPNEIINAAVRDYRRDAWQDQPTRVEVWSEKSTVQGVLAPVLDEYGVAFRVMKGFGSYTALRQAAEDSHDTDDDKDCHVLYLGDWDPSGLYMSEVDIPARLARYGSRWSFERIALERGDLATLPSFSTDTKVMDGRHAWYVTHTTANPVESWEIDALDPNHLRERVASRIAQFIEPDAWAQSLRIQTAEVDSMRRFQRAWKGVQK